MIENIHNIIKKEYENKQKLAFDKLAERKRDVYSNILRISSIDDEIQALGLKYSKMILKSGDAADRLSDELLSKTNELRKEKLQLLSGAGYPEDYLEISYQCPKCGDTGFVRTGIASQKCTCYQQQVFNYLYSQANLKAIETENFEFFKDSFYPDIIDEKRYGMAITPRENILAIKHNCQKFIENFSSHNERDLFFCGPTGVGKTFMANCIACELLNKGVTVLYQTAPVLFSTINEYRLKAYKQEDFQDTGYKNIFEVELLIIDDLGTESPSAARYAELLNILNIRHNNNLTKPCKTIISTNIEIKKLSEYYDERIVSRIIGYFDMFKFTGDDIRTVKMLKA